MDAPTAAELDRGLNALYARLATPENRKRRAIGWSVLALSAVAALLLAALAAYRVHGPFRVATSEPAALVYRVVGGQVLEGGYLQESGSAGIELLFSEGSHVVLTPGSRGRLRGVDKDGARVAIDQGTASFQVTPSHERRWWVEVGPFSVEVKGTVFTVDWDPSSERFSLTLRNGRVAVSGPLPGGDIALHAGQRLSVNLPKAETLIAEYGSESAADGGEGALTSPASPLLSPPVPAPPPGVASSAASASSPPAAKAHAKASGNRRWATQLATGDWNGILADVERSGIGVTLDTAASEDLFDLATAARYRRRPDLARSALLALRSRFPDSPRALEAAFDLGRVEEARGSENERAIDWYDEYLARSPSGPYAAEALGRKMVLTDERNGHAAARPIAEEYLRRFPRGSYAGSARALLGVP